jgi:hypothetical protein
MRKGIAWFFGILFGSALAFAVWEGFTNPNFLMGETTKVSGKIIDVFPSREVKTFRRRVKYVYAANDKYYCDYKKLGTKDKKQVIGNKLHIFYSTKNPKNNRIGEFQNNYRNYNVKKYYSKTNRGYWEIKFINGIFKCKEHGEKGIILHDFVGDYSINNDSIQFNHFHLDADSILISKPELFVFDPNHANQIIEVNTQTIYKEIKIKR